MSIKTHYIDDIFYPEVTYNTNDYGSMMKILCERFAADIPEGTITNTEIMSDTTTQYSVRYQLWGKPLYLELRNSSMTVYIGLCEKVDGVYKNITSSSNNNSLTVTTIESCRILIVGYGDFMIDCDIKWGGRYVTFNASWGVDSITGSDIYVGRSTAGTSSLESYSIINPLSNTTMMYSKIYDQPVAMDICGISNNVTYVTRGTGYVRCWILDEMFRVCTASSRNVSFQMKYGGKYDAYKLYSTENAVMVTPGTDYIVDGITYKAIFPYLYKFVENTN